MASHNSKKDYPNISKVFIEKRTANKWAKQVETEMERGIFEDFTKAHSIIVRDLLVKYQKEITPKKKGYREETHKLNFLIRHPVFKLSLMRMKSSDIYSLINELKDKNRKPQTVKHYVQHMPKFLRLFASVTPRLSVLPLVSKCLVKGTGLTEF